MIRKALVYREGNPVALRQMGGEQVTVSAGTLIGDRFEVEAEIGSGGMGAVYRAHDRVKDVKVAVKVLAGADASADRFVREARLLAALSHPAIVRYLAHGASPAGPFLAMEWLEGEDLSQRLEREALGLGDTLEVVRRAAEALSVAHRAGVVHRDIKPSNLFLQGGDPARLKVLDFGVARAQGATKVMTRTGMMVGTVGYMAPEQARGRKDIDARVDVFALGCVFYECVTGRAAFEGGNPMALLAQLMLEDPPRISELRPEVSPAVDELVARMMAKERDERPSNVEAVLVALESLGRPTAAAPTAPKPAVAMTGSEQRLANVLLLQFEEADPDATLTPEQATNEAEAVQEVIEPFDGECTRLGLGPYLIVLRGRGAATDEAGRAASCALALAGAFPEARVALATGRAGTGAGMPLGPGVESASELLSGATSGSVRIDSVTASLLDPRFEVIGDQLRGELASSAGVRKLLGKPTRCVGRRKELRLLRDMMDECAEERFAQTMLVTAPAGTGKSRLRHELLSTVDRDQWTILEARATPVGAGAPLLLARQLVTQWLGDEVRDFAGILDRVAPLELEDAPRVAEFLGEAVGIISDRAPSPQLQVARNDERMKADWIGRSVAEWLGAIAARGPLLTVLEDLHWGDAATVGHLELALREAPETPWLVLALARPEVDDAFPRLWNDTELQRLGLTGLSGRAAKQLVRNVLPDVTDATVDEIVERADGNAFFLEELIRHANDGGGALPETVLAMMESRLLKLDQQPRRVLQAASVLGERFDVAAVEALVGDSEVTSWLDHLVDQELVEPDRDRPGTFVFRHGLLRDAAYAMLLPDDRRVAHSAAADYLESRGSAEPLTMLEHLEKADRGADTPPWYLAAAEATLAQTDTAAGIRLANEGLDRGAEGELRGKLLTKVAFGHVGQTDTESAVQRYDDALRHLTHGSAAWFDAVSGKIFAAGLSNRVESALGEVAAVLQCDPLPGLNSATGNGVALVATMLEWVGQIEPARALIERVEHAAKTGNPDPAFLGWLQLRRGNAADIVDEDPARALIELDAALELAHDICDPLILSTALMTRGMVCGSIGAHDEVFEVRRRLEEERPIGLMLYWALVNSFWTFIELGDLDGAQSMVQRLEQEHSEAFPEVFRTALRGELLRATGDPAQALRAMSDLLPSFGPFSLRYVVAVAHVAIVHSHLALGNAEAALHVSKQGVAIIGAGVNSRLRTELRQLHADALLANGRVDHAKEVIREARGHLLRIQQSLPERYRSNYLTSLACHRRTMKLAAELLDG